MFPPPTCQLLYLKQSIFIQSDLVIIISFQVISFIVTHSKQSGEQERVRVDLQEVAGEEKAIRNLQL